MAIKTIDQSPSVTDQILFEILTTDSNGCFTDNPYIVDNVSIYYFERNFDQGCNAYDKVYYNQDVQQVYEQAVTNMSQNPSADNLSALEKAKSALNQSVIRIDNVYFSNLKLVASFGTPDYPAWLSTDVAHAYIANIPQDVLGNDQYGHFELDWNPVGMREGDYLVSWTWHQHTDGLGSSDYRFFSLTGESQALVSIPTHYTVAWKYETLLERYLPEFLKTHMTSDDLTPEVIYQFNQSVADLFIFVENMANRIVDLLDSNAIQEYFLPALGNLFNLQLRSHDPTLWRRQIRRAIPLYKKKGTYSGLEESLSQSGIGLNKFTKLWQTRSPCTEQDMFTVVDGLQFTFSKPPITPFDTDNFELYYRGTNDDSWTQLTSDPLLISMVDTITFNWTGALTVGDSIRIIYKFLPILDQSIENYIRTLPLLDDRDERLQDCPMKNWNMRLIEEDDPAFSAIIQNRHPYQDPLIYGWVRTEFAYSEKAYNKDEYNGSLQESNEPCDIDCYFLDPCESCQSSKYNISVQVNNLSDNMVDETKAILEDYLPFHCMLNKISFEGLNNDFVQPPVEEIKAQIQAKTEQIVICGGQYQFNRGMLNRQLLFREDTLTQNGLATMNPIPIFSGTGSARNEKIVLFSSKGFNEASVINGVLEILAPGPNAGSYGVSYIVDNYHVVISGITDSFVSSSFAFRLSSNLKVCTTTQIEQDNLYKFRDPNVNFGFYKIQGLRDGSTPWKIQISSHNYDINNILPDGSLLLVNDEVNPLPSAGNGIHYNLVDNTSVVQATSTTGILQIILRGKATLPSIPVRNFVIINDCFYLLYSGNQYKIIGFVEGFDDKVYISNYAGGDAAGQTTHIYRRVVDEASGMFVFHGEKIVTSVNHETGLNIQNGKNGNSLLLTEIGLKENYLINIDSDYFAISEIDGTTINLAGPHHDWTTSGTSVNYSIYQFEKVPVSIDSRTYPTIPAHDFTHISRGEQEIIESEQVLHSTGFATTILNSGDMVEDVVNMKENISYKIVYKDKNG